MSNRIINGTFDLAFEHWNNGVGGALPFLVEGVPEKMAKAISSQQIYTPPYEYRMTQAFSVTDEIVSATVDVWGKWQSVSGPDGDGQNEFTIWLRKPSTAMVQLYNSVKTDAIGSGQLLSAHDIKANMDEFGTYELWLELTSRSARDDDLAVISQPYNNWVNNGFILWDSNQKLTLESYEGGDLRTATISKTMIINNPATLATITVTARGYIGRTGARAYARVRLRKIGGSWNTLREKSVGWTEDWENILDGVDVASYFYGVGEYELELYAETRATYRYFDETWYFGVVDFNDLDLHVEWSDLTSSVGWYDTINVDVTVKKFKTVAEQMGGIEDYGPTIAKVSEKEIAQLAEATSRISKIKRFLEGAKIAETYETFAAFKAEVKEIIGLLEAYSAKQLLKRTQAEVMGIIETYEAYFTTESEVKEVFALTESYTVWQSLHKAMTDAVSFLEAYAFNVWKSVGEPIPLAEAYSTKASLFRTQLENINIAESYQSIRGALREATDILGLGNEVLTATKTAGNVITNYSIEALTEWDQISKVVTQWIKTKTELGG